MNSPYKPRGLSADDVAEPCEKFYARAVAVEIKAKETNALPATQSRREIYHTDEQGQWVPLLTNKSAPELVLSTAPQPTRRELALLERVLAAWGTQTDMRLGQLLVNALQAAHLFYAEDLRLVEAVERYAAKTPRKKEQPMSLELRLPEILEPRHTPVTRSISEEDVRELIAWHAGHGWGVRGRRGVRLPHH
jgi:hypothetical protein